MWIYIKNDDNSARFVLGEAGRRPLICFGINSSTAKPPCSQSNPEENLDPTVKRVRRCSQDGFDGWIMLNIYPQRATDPKRIHTEKNGALHKRNLSEIKKIFCLYPSLKVWAAWGNLIEKRPFLMRFLKDIVALNPSIQWVCKGKTKKGHPRHPLFLKKGRAFESFDMEEYLKQ